MFFVLVVPPSPVYAKGTPDNPKGTPEKEAARDKRRADKIAAEKKRREEKEKAKKEREAEKEKKETEETVKKGLTLVSQAGSIVATATGNVPLGVASGVIGIMANSSGGDPPRNPLPPAYGTPNTSGTSIYGPYEYDSNGHRLMH